MMTFEVFERSRERKTRSAREPAIATVYRSGQIHLNEAARRIIGESAEHVAFLVSRKMGALAIQVRPEKGRSTYRFGGSSSALGTKGVLKSLGVKVDRATSFPAKKIEIDGAPALLVKFRDGKIGSRGAMDAAKAREVRERAAADKTLTHEELARPYGVTRECIRLVLAGLVFPNAGGPIEPAGSRQRRRGEQGRAKEAALLEERIRHRQEKAATRSAKRAPAIEAYLSGKTQQEVADEFKTSQTVISRWLTEAGVSRGRGRGNVTERQRAWGKKLAELRRERRGA